VAKLLLEAGAEVDVKTKQSGPGCTFTPLSQAALNNSLEVAELILAAGAEVNARSKVGRTALHWAAEKNSLSVAALLLGTGADVDLKTHVYKTRADRKNNGRTALQLAQERNHQEMVALLQEEQEPQHLHQQTQSLPNLNIRMRQSQKLNVPSTTKPRCSSPVKPTVIPETIQNDPAAINSMSVKELKNYISAKGVSYKNCCEKADLLELAHSVSSAQPVHVSEPAPAEDHQASKDAGALDECNGWEEDARKMFRVIDINGDGGLDQAEVYDILLGIGLLDNQIEQIFTELDTDGDGEISEEEFVAGYQYFTEAWQEAAESMSVKELKKYLTTRNMQHTDCIERADLVARVLQAPNIEFSRRVEPSRRATV